MRGCLVAIMRECEGQALEIGAHQSPLTKAWKIGSSHYLNMNLANIRLDQ